MVGQTSGFMPRDIRALIADASSSLVPTDGISIENNEPQKMGESSSHEPNPPKDIQPLGKEFMTKALERSKKRNASALGTPKVVLYIVEAAGWVGQTAGVGSKVWYA